MYVTKEAPRAVGGFRQGLADLLRHPRYEVFPLAGIEDKVAASAPPEATITVTASPRRGMGETIDLVERLSARGYAVVPHLSARLISGEVELKEILDRLDGLRISEIFVIAGDPDQPLGPYTSAVDLLRSIDELGYRFAQVGVSGYPESHPKIADDVAVQAMWDKRAYATYVVSQMCFDPVLVRRWIARLRSRGITLPVYAGVPGPAAIGSLLKIGSRVGVGESRRFLSSQGMGLLRLGKPGRYTPDRLLDKLVSHRPADPGSAVDDGPAGLHFYTFNDIRAAEDWRRAKLARLDMR